MNSTTICILQKNFKATHHERHTKILLNVTLVQQELFQTVCNILQNS